MLVNIQTIWSLNNAMSQNDYNALIEKESALFYFVWLEVNVPFKLRKE